MTKHLSDSGLHRSQKPHWSSTSLYTGMKYYLIVFHAVAVLDLFKVLDVDLEYFFPSFFVWKKKVSVESRV